MVNCNKNCRSKCLNVLLLNYHSKNWIKIATAMPRLNNDDRNRILGLLEGGLSQTQVALRFNVARCTINRLVQRYRATGSVADRPRAGAPRVTSRRQDVYIRVRHLRNRFLTASSTARVIMGNRYIVRQWQIVYDHTVYGAGDPIKDCCSDVSIVMLGCSGLAKMCKTETGEMLFSLMNQDSISLMLMVDAECLGDVTNVILIPVL